MRKYKFTCIVDTVYTLSLYLLYQSYEDIQRTLFFVGSTIPDEMCEHLPNCVKLSTRKEDYDCKEKLKAVRWELYRKYRWKILCTRIYAQDHLKFSPQLIGGQKYTLLEDGPRSITLNKDNPMFQQNIPQDLKTRLWLKIYLGQTFGYVFGTHKQCVNRILTSPDDVESPLVKGRHYELVSMENLWNGSTMQKKAYIKHVFGISEQMEGEIKASGTIFFTQPFIDDCGLTEQEQVDIVSPYYERYKSTGFMIKPHPRDRVDYKKYFPDARIMHCKAPMQLVNIMGLTCKRAITVSSTAVSALPPETELIRIGNSVNEKIAQVLGESRKEQK